MNKDARSYENGSYCKVDQRRFNRVCIPVQSRVTSQCTRTPGAGPGFLKRGFHLCKGVGVRFADFIYVFLNIP